MAKQKQTRSREAEVNDYRHGQKRKNIPPAGLAAQGKVQEAPKTRYFYDPHLPPVLRFDESGAADRLPELLEAAKKRPLTEEEAQLMAEALRNRQPWLEWAGKREKAWFDVDPVALHIHERLSAQAIIKLAARQPLQRSMFADPELEYQQAVQFYKHDVDWANRLILGDSLTVMHSLARREDLAGKVQMIYMDPPYGIKFASNFQSEVGNRDVKEKESDLTREPEQIKAYRDTWTLGVHSYLAYLRDRLRLAKDLLCDGGSIFIQIGEDNVHRLRLLMDEVFGDNNQVGTIAYRTSIGLGAKYLDLVTNYLLWYSSNIEKMKYHPIFQEVRLGEEGATRYLNAENEFGESKRLTEDELDKPELISQNWKPYFRQGLTSRSGSPTTQFPVAFCGKDYVPTAGGWRTNNLGMGRLVLANRVIIEGNRLTFKKMFSDFGAVSLTNFWSDVSGGIQSRSDPKIFVVQTATTIIERCVLMTTEPGDLVLDPTCGSGTTAYVAEQWGRRWITIDTSRVAVALARQRLLTAKYDYYELSDPQSGPTGNFVYKTVPHITLKTIAQNQALDQIFAKWEPVLQEKLDALNAALPLFTAETRMRLQAKLLAKEKHEGKKAVTDADRRRWLLPPSPPTPLPKTGEGSYGWKEWEVPFDTDPDWPAELQRALLAYRKAWRGKMDEVNAVIAASAPQETLVDQPKVASGVLRVSGPFTVEGVQPIEEALEGETPIGGEPEELDTFEVDAEIETEPQNAAAYLEKMTRLLRQDGVRFPDNKVLRFDRLEPMANSVLHAEGEWGSGTEMPMHVPTMSSPGRRLAVSFGPQYGPITAQQVEECLREAYRRGYDDLIFAGFTIDGAAQAIIQDDPNPQVRCHLAHIRPDVNMGDLLKDTPSSQLFTVFGLPRVKLSRNKAGEWVVEMEGVDIYDPVENTIRSTGANKVAAWFMDSDYDGQTFCINQAFFPDSSAWDKLAKALKSTVDPERFEAFSGTKSLPFEAGKHQRIAVKVIDPRGNEVMRVMRTDENNH